MVQTLHEVREALMQCPVPSDTSGSVDVGASREGIVISLAGNLLFDSGKSDLKPRGMTLLDTLAERLRTMPNEIRVEGHTDNIADRDAAVPLQLGAVVGARDDGGAVPGRARRDRARRA